MEINIEEIKTPMKLSAEDRLAELIQCSPWQESSFRLCCQPGILLKVNDSAIVEGSKYKSVRISSNTTVRKVISMVSGSETRLDLVLIEEGKGVLNMNLCPGLEDWERRNFVLTRALSGERRKVHHRMINELKREPSQNSLGSVDSGYGGLSANQADYHDVQVQYLIHSVKLNELI